jgi:protein arginine kinase
LKTVDELVKQPGAWLKVGENTGIVVSSRLRLARNISGHPFPGWADEKESVNLLHELSPVLEHLSTCAFPLLLEMSALNRVEKEILIERHLISRDLAEKSKGSAVILKHDESVAIMVNEEDHVRMQAMSPALNLRALLKQVDELDAEIETHFEYAFSPRLGYLTACPSNVGTGIRASVMLHLPGLVLMNEINSIIKAVHKMGLAVRGLWGEGTDAAGNMFQISNQVTLGETERTIVERLEKIVLEIDEHEKNSRTRLLEQRENQLRDHFGRAIGILTHAHMLTSKETLDMLSALRLGLEMGLISGWRRGVIDELFVLIQPGHLQKLEGKIISSEKRDLARARLVRERLTRESA